MQLEFNMWNCIHLVSQLTLNRSLSEFRLWDSVPFRTVYPNHHESCQLEREQKGILFTSYEKY